MKALNYKDYFLCPIEVAHRRYEALRSVIVEERPMKEVAQRFELSYGTVRNWVSEFCRGQDAGQSPPFLFHRRAVVPQSTKPIRPTMILKSKLPMFARCRWKRDVA